MQEEEASDVPEGAAVFPLIPQELGVDPLLLAVVHSLVFLAGSDESIVNSAAADEAVGRIAEYLRRLEGKSLQRVEEDFRCLASFAQQQKWPKQLVRCLKSLLKDCGVGEGRQA